MTLSLTHRLQRHLTAAALLAALAVPAMAQPTPSAPPASGPGKTAEMRERHQARHADRLARLKEQLKLAPEQEGAWTTFITAMKPPTDRPARLDRAEMEKLSTPERIDRMRAVRAQHAADADRRGEATKAFYAGLNAEQKKTFDAQTRHMGGPREGGPRDDHGGRGGHHGGMGGPGGMRGGERPAS